MKHAFLGGKKGVQGSEYLWDDMRWIWMFLDWIEVVDVVESKGYRRFSLCDIKWFREMNRLSLPKQGWVEFCG